MNKKDLIKALSEKTELSEKVITSVIDALPGVIGEELKNGGGVVTIPNVAQLKREHRAERNGRNPQTGESMTIKAKDVVKVKSAGSMGKLFA